MTPSDSDDQNVAQCDTMIARLIVRMQIDNVISTIGLKSMRTAFSSLMPF